MLDVAQTLAVLRTLGMHEDDAAETIARAYVAGKASNGQAPAFIPAANILIRINVHHAGDNRYTVEIPGIIT